MILKSNSSKIMAVLIFSVVVYSIFIMLGDVGDLFSNLIEIKIEFLLLSILLSTIGFTIRSLRWHLMLRKLEFNIPIKNSMLIYFSGYAYFLTPGRIGEIIRSQFLKDQYQIPFNKSAATVFVERVYDVLGIITIISLTSIASYPLVIYVAISTIIIIYFLIFQRTILLKILFAIKNIKFLHRLTEFFQESFDVVTHLLKPKTTIIGTVLTIISWILESTAMYVIFYSFNLEIGIVDTIFIYVLSTLIGSSTLIPGGIGPTDGSIIGLLLIRNMDYNEILVPVLIARFLLVWYALGLGLIANILRKKCY